MVAFVNVIHVYLTGKSRSAEPRMRRIVGTASVSSVLLVIACCVILHVFCRLLIFVSKNLLGIPSEFHIDWTLIRPDDLSDLGQNCLPKLSADDTGRQNLRLSLVYIKFYLSHVARKSFFEFLNRK